MPASLCPNVGATSRISDGTSSARQPTITYAAPATSPARIARSRSRATPSVADAGNGVVMSPDGIRGPGGGAGRSPGGAVFATPPGGVARTLSSSNPPPREPR